MKVQVHRLEALGNVGGEIELQASQHRNWWAPHVTMLICALEKTTHTYAHSLSLSSVFNEAVLL